MVPPSSRLHASRRRSRSPLGVSGRSLRGNHNNVPLRHLRETNLFSEYRPKFREEPLNNGARRDFGPRRYAVSQNDGGYVQSAPWVGRSRGLQPNRLVADYPRRSSAEFDVESKRIHRHRAVSPLPPNPPPDRYAGDIRIANFSRGYYEERSRGREWVVERERRYDPRGDYQQYRNERQQPYEEMSAHGGRQGGRSFGRDAWRSDRVPSHRNAPVVVSPHPRQKPRYNISAPQRYERPSTSFGVRAVRSNDGGGRGSTHSTYRTGRGSVRRPAFRTGPMQRPPPPRR
ncbi:hypothetical protein TSMEX_002513 [Taenia solium]|eukprot:TsM_000077600 transcript=TsM_000077600 gene=TsM_000077600